MSRGLFYLLMVIFLLGGLVLALSIFSAVKTSAEARAALQNERTMEGYVQSAFQCRKKWPHADAYEVHECAIGMIE